MHIKRTYLLVRSPSILFLFLIYLMKVNSLERRWFTTDELENHISPEDLRELLALNNSSAATTTSMPPTNDVAGADYVAMGYSYGEIAVPNIVDCFGLDFITRKLTWLFNMRPDTSNDVNTHFYFSSRKQPKRVQVLRGEQFGLEWVDFSATRKTVLIVHGFLSHSNATWVTDMTKALLQWADVNVIAVDWSRGGNTWKYWRAVANTRRVGSDITSFMQRLIAVTGARVKDFHFIGHSLGAHICSYASYYLGRVARITGLDPAQPCFRTSSNIELLDPSDADFVDVIHTNGRLLNKIGFGLPEPAGHADFYPNGGMKQPGCLNRTTSMWNRFIPNMSISPSKLQEAVCNHGRAYLLFTESLINHNCSFRAHRWNLTYEGVNASLVGACDRLGSCSVMGIAAAGGAGFARAQGAYFVLTTDTFPYCPTENERRHPRLDLLRDLQRGFLISESDTVVTRAPDLYADPDLVDDNTKQSTPPTTVSSWFHRWFRRT